MAFRPRLRALLRAAGRQLHVAAAAATAAAAGGWAGASGGVLDLSAIGAALTAPGGVSRGDNGPGRFPPPKLSPAYDVDIVVIGGGSGGLACARAAAEAGGRVTLFDHVSPSPRGTTWGLGGTCVNVGCVPKKLMHHAALLGQGMADAGEFGWAVPAGVTHGWAGLVGSVQAHIRGTNWGYRAALRDERVEYLNARAAVAGPHEVAWTDPATGAPRRLTTAHIVVATGGRPRYPDGVPGAAEHGLTSDDLFSLGRPPGRTLLVGGGYVALECAGLLTHLGHPATVMARGAHMRGFDRDCAGRVVAHMRATGTAFLDGCVPVRVEREGGEGGGQGGRYRVWWSRPGAAAAAAAAGGDAGAPLESDVFDTVVFATGRAPCTRGLGLEAAGVALDASGKVLGRRGGGAGEEGGDVGAPSPSAPPSIWSETSSVPSIHAVGDVLAGAPELTPVAIRAGRLLAGRIMGGVLPTEGAAEGAAPATAASAASTAAMDYRVVPTTVFTPMEYACVGLSEEAATAAHGADGIDVYQAAFDTLELAVAHRPDADGLPLPPQCFAKLVVTRGATPEQERVLGAHLLAPSAGEAIQGLAVALRLGATRADLLATPGVHPTGAEELLALAVTKRSGKPFARTAC